MSDNEFLKATETRGSVLGEYWALLRETRKWWLAPILVLLLMVGLFVALGGTAAAPLIYAIF